MKVTENLRRQWQNQREQAVEEREFTQSGIPRSPEDVEIMDFEIAMMDKLLALPVGAKFNAQEIQKELERELGAGVGGSGLAAEETAAETADEDEEVQVADEEIQEVANALMKEWFPNGHPGAARAELAEDYAEWKKGAEEDARCALIAVRKLDARKARERGGKFGQIGA